MKDKLKKLFASNTEKNEVHYTSDGIMFFDKSHAQIHANGKDDKTITTVTREEVLREETDADLLAAIRKRQEEIKTVIDSYKDEWMDLQEREHALLEKLAKASPDAESEAAKSNQDTGNETGAGDDQATGAGADQGTGTGNETGAGDDQGAGTGTDQGTGTEGKKGKGSKK